MEYTLQKLIRAVQLCGIENPDSGTMDPDDIVDKINEEQEYLGAQILRTRPDMLCTYFDLTTTGLREYGISNGIPRYIDHVFAIEDVSGSDPMGTDVVRFEDRFSYLSSVTNETIRWYYNKGKLGIPSADTGTTIRVWYPKRPVPLFYGTVSSGTSNTIVFPSSPTAGELIPENDIYNGMLLKLNDGQVREITDYVASTRTATVDVAWGTTPTNANTVSLVSPIFPRFQELLHLGASLRLKIGLDDEIQPIRFQYDRLYQSLEAFMRKEQSQEPQRVRHIPR